MPWYSPNSAPAALRQDRDDVAEMTTSVDSHRRAVSLDLNRLGASEVSRNALASGLAEEEPGKKFKRSSFARLSASWRFGGRANKCDGLAGDHEGDVELQPGYATEFSATGLRGGFVVSPSASDASSSLYRASSSTRSYASSSTRATEEDYDEQLCIRTPPQRLSMTSSPHSSDIGEKTETPLASPTISKKSKSRGWFSFSSSTNPAEGSASCTPTDAEHVTPPTSLVTAPRSPLRPHTKLEVGSSAQILSATALPSPKSVNKLRLPNTSMGRTSGRKRGDSEVSMKDLIADRS